jgi:hypothetical protein
MKISDVFATNAQRAPVATALYYFAEAGPY